jgi:hypothetical protein
MAGLDWLRERELTEARLKKVDKLKAIAEKIDLSCRCSRSPGA